MRIWLGVQLQAKTWAHLSVQLERPRRLVRRAFSEKGNLNFRRRIVAAVSSRFRRNLPESEILMIAVDLVQTFPSRGIILSAQPKTGRWLPGTWRTRQTRPCSSLLFST
jgi:hypothetical protein